MFNVAVVGMGWWGKIIVPLLKTSHKITVSTVVEINPAAIADFAAQHGVKVVTRLEDVLKDPAIQGVVLCTPHTQHTADHRGGQGWQACVLREAAVDDPRRRAARDRGRQ